MLGSSFQECRSRNFLTRTSIPLPAASFVFLSVGRSPEILWREDWNLYWRRQSFFVGGRSFLGWSFPFLDCSLVDCCVGVEFSGMSVQKFSDPTSIPLPAVGRSPEILWHKDGNLYRRRQSVGPF